MNAFLLSSGPTPAEWVDFRDGGLIAAAKATVGAPATPVSYAGLARRSTVGVGAPRAGVAAGYGERSPVPGVAPANRDDPVSRVGVR
jgi:hypothetical protein